MHLRTVILAGALLLGSVQAATFANYIFTPPAGWTQTRRGSSLIFTPPAAAAGENVAIRLTPGGVVQGTLSEWFAAQIASYDAGASVVSQSPVQKNTSTDGQTVLSKALLVQDNGRSEWRFFVAAQPGKRGEMLVYSAATLAAFTRYQGAFTAFTDSVDFANMPKPLGSKPAGSTAVGKTPTASTQATKTPTPPASKLPAVPVPKLAALVQAGLNPEKQAIPDEFHCYLSYDSADYSKPVFSLQILAGGRYRAPGGEGSYSMVHDGSLDYLRWKGGPLAGTDDAFLLFDRTYGQRIRLDGVTDQDRRVYCYQRGGSEAHALVQFRRNDPQPGAYRCRSTDGSNADKGTLQVLASRRYTYAGGSGSYKVNLLGNQGDTYSSMDFSGGPLEDTNTTYSEDESGARQISVINRMKCVVVVKPIQEPQFGSDRAPAPPAGAGGLDGAYATHFQQFGPNPGVQHQIYVFHKNGYVSTREPDTSLQDNDCTRTLPSGLPVCELYTFRNGLLTIGDDKPKRLERTRNGFKLDGDELLALKPLSKLTLSGTYQATSTFSAVGGTGGGIFQDTLTLHKDGSFSKASDGGVSISTTTDGTAFGDSTGGVSSSSSRTSSGRYSFSGNTLTLQYSDGRSQRMFAYLPTITPQGQPDLTWLYAGGSDYFLQKPKK